MTTNKANATTASARWIATETIIWNPRPADRSRNGQRTPRSVKHRAGR